jgi:hypothetical protein
MRPGAIALVRRPLEGADPVSYKPLDSRLRGNDGSYAFE